MAQSDQGDPRILTRKFDIVIVLFGVKKSWMRLKVTTIPD